nr:tetratricopeptide repeat protein [Acetobacter persici]
MLKNLISRLFGKRNEPAADNRLLQAKSLLEQGEHSKAFTVLTTLAREGQPEAQYLVGQAYLNAQGAPPNLIEGARWTRRAALKGWDRAAFILATLYLHGLPPEVEEGESLSSVFEDYKKREKAQPDYYKAARWARQAAEAGNPDAQALYGYILSAGPDDIRDPDQALLWYQKSADAGCLQGYLGLGLAALKGAQTYEQYAQAAVELQKAADGGLGTALYLMGVMAERGTGVPQDDALATAYFGRAAEQNVRGGQAKYGIALWRAKGLSGTATGVKAGCAKPRWRVTLKQRLFWVTGMGVG